MEVGGHYRKSFYIISLKDAALVFIDLNHSVVNNVLSSVKH